MEATKFVTIGQSNILLKIRPEQHVTDSEASAIFESVFSDWAVNPSKRDYGWDFNVELFRNNEATGDHFYGQLKGSRHTEYSSDGSFVSQSLDYDDADYLARLLKQPTFLFHADVVSKRLFWCSIQLDQKVLTALEAGGVKSLTVRIPTANVLPDCLSAFLLDINRSLIIVMRRILRRTTHFDFVDAMAGQPLDRCEDEASDLHQKAFILEMELAQRQLRGGDLVGAISAVQKVVSNSSSYIEVHFNATIHLGQLEVLQ